MSRRIDIELTSIRDDDSWTWRAVGAREPKGTIAADLLPKGTSVGDELRVEAEFLIDGIEITSVLPAKGERKEPEVLEILGSGRDQGGVTTSLVPKRGRRGDRDDSDRGRGGRRPRGDSKGRSRRDERGAKGERRPRQERPERPPPPAKPKPKRLRPKRTHRDAVMTELPEEQRPIAEQVLRGGIPGVRKAVEEQNARNKTEGRPEIDPAPLVQLAESLLPRLKDAEWRDRADAALAGIAEVDLRDLRSVVVAAESNARSDENRALAEQLRTAVAERVDAEHGAWLREIAGALDDERTVRALRMSSRPPKAGAPLPPDLSSRLVEAANSALTADTGPQRWGTVLDAVAYSPIRASVTPAGVPSRVNEELLETVKKLSNRVPDVAALFGVEPQKPQRKRRRSKKQPAPAAEKPKPKAQTVVEEPEPTAQPKPEEPGPTAEPVVEEPEAAVAPKPEKPEPTAEPVVEEPEAAVAPKPEEPEPRAEPVVEEPAAGEPVVDEPEATSPDVDTTGEGDRSSDEAPSAPG